VSEAIERGSLCHLLPDYAFPMQGIYAVYPDTRHMTQTAAFNRLTHQPRRQQRDPITLQRKCHQCRRAHLNG
jgi:hypothetical protein